MKINSLSVPFLVQILLWFTVVVQAQPATLDCTRKLKDPESPLIWLPSFLWVSSRLQRRHLEEFRKTTVKKRPYAIVSSTHCQRVISPNLWKCKLFVFRRLEEKQCFLEEAWKSNLAKCILAHPADTCHTRNKNKERLICLHSDLAVSLYAVQNTVKQPEILQKQC